MKKLMNMLVLVSLSVFLFIYGCDKNPTTPESYELTNTEKMVVVAAEFAEPTGGVTSDLNAAFDAANGDIGNLQKTSSFDTTISADWITYELSLNFYTKNGTETNRYIPALTDSVVFNGHATGHKTSTSPTQDITLNRTSTFQIVDILTNSVTIDGSGANNSNYTVTNDSSLFKIEPSSNYTFENLKVNLSSGSYIPYSGKIIAKIKGHITKSGVGQDRDTDYSFEVTVKFVGNETVEVTLPSGIKFKLNLRTGEFSLI